MRIWVSRHPNSPVRCALCRGRLTLLSPTCPGCGTRLHADCRRQLGRCPTLGCPTLDCPAPSPTPRLPLKPVPLARLALTALGSAWHRLRLALGLAVLAATCAVGAWQHLAERRKPEQARAELERIDLAIRRYERDTGTRPWSLADLRSPPPHTPGWRGPYLGPPSWPPRDPWGWCYEYEHRGSRSYELISHGEDGLPGGLGAARDIRLVREGAGPTRVAVPGGF